MLAPCAAGRLRVHGENGRRSADDETKPGRSGNIRHGAAVTYRIRVQGLLAQEWGEWFDGFVISYEAGHDTTLTGSVVDQGALHGLLARMRDLGLTLLRVERVDLPPDRTSDAT
jgi:hypothetical protein